MSHEPTSYSRTETASKLVVGVGDMVVTNDVGAVIVTYALGSCIGLTVYDPVARVGGLLHFMLPNAELNAQKALNNPAMFGDTGVPNLFKACYDLGAHKERLVVCAAGGAEVIADDGHFRIGSRNRTLLRKLFWKNSILLAGDDTGGERSRTLSLSMSDGVVAVRSQGEELILWPA